MGREKKLNIGNEIIEIPVFVKCPKCMLGRVLERETNYGNEIVEIGGKKNCGNGIAKIEEKKKCVNWFVAMALLK